MVTLAGLSTAAPICLEETFIRFARAPYPSRPLSQILTKLHPVLSKICTRYVAGEGTELFGASTVVVCRQPNSPVELMNCKDICSDLIWDSKIGGAGRYYESNLAGSLILL